LIFTNNPIDRAGKDPLPEDVALICPQTGLVNVELKFIVCWSSGVMECWSIGTYKNPIRLWLISNIPCRYEKAKQS
jgi:hypothetical protein